MSLQSNLQQRKSQASTQYPASVPVITELLLETGFKKENRLLDGEFFNCAARTEKATQEHQCLHESFLSTLSSGVVPAVALQARNLS